MPTQTHHRAPVDALEGRRLFFTPTASISNGVLNVLGGRTGDFITVAQDDANSDTITVKIFAYGNGTKGAEQFNDTFSPAGLDRVFIDGDDGADVLDARGMRTDLAVLIYGNGKSDQMFGGPGNDTLRGGTGNDLMTGGDGNDLLVGDGGDDSIGGDDGDDRISGSYGEDTLVGADGADTIHGDDGSDSIAGGGGNDRLYGGTQPDTLDGGGGSVDHLYGNGGDDLLIGSSHRAYLDGGGDTDSAKHRKNTDVVETSIEVQV